MSLETTLLWAGGSLYLAATAWAVFSEARGRSQTGTMVLVALALLGHGASILLRWDRLGHGPYLNLFGALSGNVWTLHASLLLAVMVLPRLRALLATGLPVLAVSVIWLLSEEPLDSRFPRTFDTAWLAIHIWLGKFFIGILIVAVAAGLVVGLRALVRQSLFPSLPPTEVLDELNFRLVLLAFVFDSLMIVAGAIWAQNAWGRYWSWDRLEIWSFLTWLSVGTYLHFRFTAKPPPIVSTALILIAFALAYTTYFGVPFLSQAPHKGMI